MKTLSKLSFLFAVLVFSVFGMIGCNDSGGGDSPPPPKQEPIPVPTPVPVPDPIPPPTLVFTADEITIVASSVSVKLTWSAENANQCSASGDGGWSGSKPVNGTDTLSGLSAGRTYILNLVCVGSGGSTPSLVRVVVPVAPPAPINTSITCGTTGTYLSANPRTNSDGFVSIVKECRIAAENSVAFKEVTVTFGGFGDKVLDVRMMDKVLTTDRGFCVYTPTEVARAQVVNGVATLALKDFRLGRECGSVKPFYYGKSVSFELRFNPLDPLGVSELSRDLRISVTAGSDIKTVEPVVFSNTFPLQLGFARMAKGKVFYWKNNEIFRYDTATGVDTVLTYSYGSTNNPNGDIYPSSDGKSIMFFGGIPYVMDTDGAGCTPSDIPVVVSLGCNKGFKAIPLSAGRVTGGFSPDGTMFAYTISSLISPGGTLLRTQVYLARMSPFGVEQITSDEYGGHSPVIGSTGLYFYSCRPDCGIYWTEVDFSTGKPVGVIKLIYAHTTGRGGAYPHVLSSMSLDEKKFLISGPDQDNLDLHRIFLVNIDGADIREIGTGQMSKFAGDGRVTWHDPWKGAVLADGDGSNQVYLDIRSQSGFAFVP